MQSFYKIGIFKNFPKFTRKHLCWSLFFNKFAGCQPATLFNKRPQCRCFSDKFCKIFNNTSLTKHIRSTPSTPKFGPTPPTLGFLTHANILWTHAIDTTHAISLTYAKIFWTHATHAKIWLTPPRSPRIHGYPRHSRYLANSFYVTHGYRLVFSSKCKKFCHNPLPESQKLKTVFNPTKRLSNIRLNKLLQIIPK